MFLDNEQASIEPKNITIEQANPIPPIAA